MIWFYLTFSEHIVLIFSSKTFYIQHITTFYFIRLWSVLQQVSSILSSVSMSANTGFEKTHLFFILFLFYARIRLVSYICRVDVTLAFFFVFIFMYIIAVLVSPFVKAGKHDGTDH